MKKIIISILLFNSLDTLFAQSEVQNNSNQVFPKSESTSFCLKKNIFTDLAETRSKDFKVDVYQKTLPTIDNQVQYRPRETNELLRNIGKYGPVNSGDMILKATLNSLPKLKFKF
nr:hypothetical protein [uncultured Chryseobacterium sp.]